MRICFTALLLCFLTACTSLQAGQNKSPESPANSAPTGGQNKSPESPAKGNLIDALVAAPKLVHYAEDGAADASVLMLYEDGSGNVTNSPAREVKDIVALKEKAIPLLIEHLTDERPTAATFHGGYIDWRNPVRVPVGHVCLDILLSIIGDNPAVFIEDCHDDGLGSCVRDGYYFRPDDYVPVGNGYHRRQIVRIVKANWQRAYRGRKIKYNHVVRWK